MILSGEEILKQVEAGTIRINPFDPKCINPASVDIRLGNRISVYEGSYLKLDTGKQENGQGLFPKGVQSLGDWGDFFLDSKKKNPVMTWDIPEEGWILKPGIGYLMHTLERICSDMFVPIIDGKSSIGRLFVKIHETAGFGDPGYDGQYTLEVTVQIPIRVYAGMRIGQMRFHRIEGQVTSYQKAGSYTGQLATGPIESQAYRSAFR